MDVNIILTVFTFLSFIHVSCSETLCASLGHLDNGKIDYYYPGSGNELTWGTIAVFECNEDSDMEPGANDDAVCTITGEWSDRKPMCLRRAEIYPIPRGTIYFGTSYRPLDQGISVPHGTKIRLICNTKSELYSNTDRRYMNRRYPSFSSENNNGTWTPPIPECVFKRCDLNKRKYQNYKFTFTNRTDVPPKVDHNTELLGSCIDRHEFDDEYADNPSIYTCNKDHIRLYPRCVPAFCSVSLPDDMYIDEGTAELIDDIERIHHGTEIFYRCPNDREYELFLRGGYRDSVSDTCDHGQWVKKVKPICREKRCYLHANEGAMFAGQQGNTVGNRYIESRTNISINCENGFRLTDDGHPIHNDNLGQYSTCLKGQWSRNLRCEPG